jgi:ribosomal protein S18 acetylase RimI-like enzyme
MKIRHAASEDLARIAEMGRPFWEMTPLAEMIPYDPASVEYYSQLMMESGVLLVVEIDGTVVGAAGALTMPALGNFNYLVAAELFWWIEPEYRSSGVGRALLAALEDALRTRGAKVFSMVAFENIEVDRVSSIYERSGYKRTERTFSKDLMNGCSNSSSDRGGRDGIRSE